MLGGMTEWRFQHCSAWRLALFRALPGVVRSPLSYLVKFTIYNPVSTWISC